MNKLKEENTWNKVKKGGRKIRKRKRRWGKRSRGLVRTEEN
jgi:predicted RNA-binding protein